jgi:hypothetical protein
MFYADDIIIMGDSAEELGDMLRIVTAYFRNWRMSPNQKKSHIVIFDISSTSRDIIKGNRKETRRQRAFFQLDGVQLEEYDVYRYLGVWLSHDLIDIWQKPRRRLIGPSTWRDEWTGMG